MAFSVPCHWSGQKQNMSSRLSSVCCLRPSTRGDASHLFLYTSENDWIHPPQQRNQQSHAVELMCRRCCPGSPNTREIHRIVYFQKTIGVTQHTAAPKQSHTIEFGLKRVLMVGMNFLLLLSLFLPNNRTCSPVWQSSQSHDALSRSRDDLMQSKTSETTIMTKSDRKTSLLRGGAIFFCIVFL